MSESRILSQGDMKCWGADGRLADPISFNTTHFADKPVEFGCPKLGTDGISCEASVTPEICVYQREKKEKKAESILTLDTEYGKLVYDKSLREILVSPLREEGHPPQRLAHQTGLMLAGLMENQGDVLSHTQLYLISHTDTQYVPKDLKVVSVYATTIRRALGREPEGTPPDKWLISSIRQEGYTIRKPKVPTLAPDFKLVNLIA